ncbi:MAG: hypothetical protein LBN37_08080, partial [Bacteroidales bacterium]|nr:hypothetical protein [Bacteroidales bacterium]
EQIKNIQWVLASPAERDSLNKFAATYRLQDVANLTILMDVRWELHNRLQVKSIPSCYVYNRQHRLVKTVQGLVRLENIINLANK